MSHGNDSGILRIALNLTAACAVSGVILASVYVLTKDTADKAEIEMKNKSMRTLVPEADSFKRIDVELVHEGKAPERKECYEALKGQAPLAFIVPAETKGYGGAIKMLVAVSPDAKVLNYVILSANETPGLGDKAGTPYFQDRLKGKDAEHLLVVKDPADKEHVLAMTGATISSKAVTLGVKEAVELYSKQIKGAAQ